MVFGLKPLLSPKLGYFNYHQARNIVVQRNLAVEVIKEKKKKTCDYVSFNSL